ncbi:dipeptidyl aminopeptidase/acylaminoacyl peptidase [Paenibacillus shirakamiensis]|uniref:Dipeptidyl aminopeptidase/acylaminoacyl peptidase n=1 Tax=Paenibacillus shirakamiensis TaxID=1265935 RepID=A0ABS4JHM1_9BACL|nr:prolyl oligopeptidase family serine peptidase [Paenibacillus shirakamiensis]MBP2001222.1 dipeptidyl aminopeptidase/acylaminoacyl peptidase [Paenibacillus shirakamiensis]
MNIYRVSYTSGKYVVKGYLAFPPRCHVSSEQLEQWMNPAQSPELPLELIAQSMENPLPHWSGQKWPVFLYCRGGIGKVGSVKTKWLEDFARHDQIVFAPCYRGNEGGQGRDEFGGADREDVFSAFRILQSLPCVNAEKISVMGFSRGAVNAAELASGDDQWTDAALHQRLSAGMNSIAKLSYVEQSEYHLLKSPLPRVYRLILWSGVSDLSQTYEERIELRRMFKRVIGGTPHRLPQAYADRSPLFMASALPCPILVIHGTDDPQVDYSHGERMVAKLQELALDVTFHTYEGYAHHFPEAVHQTAIQRMFQWISSN